MANDTEVGLIWRLRSQGTQQVQADLRRITGTVGQTRAAAQIAPNVTGWNTALGSVKAQAVGLLGSLGKLAGFAGIGAGLFGLNAVRKDFMALDAVLLEIQNSQGLTDDQTAVLGKRFHEMGYEAGKSAAEIATLADSMSDLGTTWNRALEAAPKLDLYARSINLDDTGAVAETFSGLEKISGGQIPVMRQIAMLGEMQAATPMSEANFMQATARAAGPAGAVGNLQGEAGIRSLGGIIATLGKTYALQPRRIQGGMDQLIDVFQDTKMREAIRALGVDTTDIGTMFEGLLRKMKESPQALDGIEGLADEFKIIMQGAVANVETFKAAQKQITGNTKELGVKLDRAGSSASASLARVSESLKTALEPIVEAMANWLGKKENQEKIAAFANFLGQLGKWAAENGQTVIAFFAALAIRARMPQGAGGGPVFGGAPGAGGGGMMPMVPMMGPGGGHGSPGAAPSARAPMPPWQAGSQAQRDMQAFRASQAAGPGWGAAAGGAAMAAGGGLAGFIAPVAVFSAVVDTFSQAVQGDFRTGLAQWMEENAFARLREERDKPKRAADAAVDAAAQAAAQAVEEYSRRVAQAKIEIQLNTTVSGSGVTAQATARQDGRSAESPIVRSDHSGTWVG